MSRLANNFKVISFHHIVHIEVFNTLYACQSQYSSYLTISLSCL